MVALLLLPHDQIYVHAAEVTELATYPVLMAAAALLYVYYRFAPDAGAAWLATAAVFGTAQGLAFAAMRVVLELRVPERSVWLLLTQVLVAAILVALLILLGRGAPAVDPLGVGLCLAVAITVARLVVLERGGPSTSLQPLAPILDASLLVLYGVMAVLLLRSDRLPAAATRRLGLVVVLLGTAQLLTFPIPTSDCAQPGRGGPQRRRCDRARRDGDPSRPHRDGPPGRDRRAGTHPRGERPAGAHPPARGRRVRGRHQRRHPAADGAHGPRAGRAQPPDGAPRGRVGADGPSDRSGPRPVRTAADHRRRPRRPRRAPPAGARDPWPRGGLAPQPGGCQGAPRRPRGGARPAAGQRRPSHPEPDPRRHGHASRRRGGPDGRRPGRGHLARDRRLRPGVGRPRERPPAVRGSASTSPTGSSPAWADGCTSTPAPAREPA